MLRSMKPFASCATLAGLAALSCAAWAAGPGIAPIHAGMWELSERQQVSQAPGLDRAAIDRINARPSGKTRRTCISQAEAARGPRLLRNDGCRWDHYWARGGNVSGSKVCPNGSGTRRHDYSGRVTPGSYSIVETVTLDAPGRTRFTNYHEGRRVGACGG